MLYGDGFAARNGWTRLAVYGIPSVAILMAAILVDTETFFDNAISNSLGAASYSIYLVHMLPLGLMRWVWTKFGMPTEGVFWALVFVFCAVGSAAICGILSYLLVERPTGVALKAWLKRERSPRLGRVD